MEKSKYTAFKEIIITPIHIRKFIVLSHEVSNCELNIKH